MSMTIKQAAETLRYYIVSAHPPGYLNSDSLGELEDAIKAFEDLDKRASKLEAAMTQLIHGWKP